MTLRAAVIGAGAMGRHHARVYAALDDVDLVGVADPVAENRDWVERRLRVPTFDDHRTLLSSERPDLVSVVVPTQQHLTVALDVIAAGIAVLVEKPIAATEAEAQVMIDAAREADVVLTVGHVERFNPAVRELKRRVDAGELGRVFTVQARRVGPFPARVRDVGVVVDLATHDLDILRWIVGREVVRIQAETAQRIHTAHEDLLVGLLRFDGGAIGLLNINWLTPTKIRELSVTGERGMFVADYLRQTLTFYANESADAHWESFGQLQGVVEGNATTIRIDGGEPLVAELAAFAAAVRDRTPPVVSGEDGLAALRLARAIVEAGERGDDPAWGGP
jgi:predicted dehydrogenase